MRKPRAIHSKQHVDMSLQKGQANNRRLARRFPLSVVQTLLLVGAILNLSSFVLFRKAKVNDSNAPKSFLEPEGLRGNQKKNDGGDEVAGRLLPQNSIEAEPDSSFEDTDAEEGEEATEAKKDVFKEIPHSPPEKDEDQMEPVTDWRIVVSTNAGFEHVFLNWYKSLVKTGLDKEMPVILIADDSEVYDRYKNSTKLTVRQGWQATEKFSDPTLTGDYKYGSRNYKRLVSRRPALVLDELQHGNVLYIDIDTVLREDPRPFFKGNYDFWGQKHRHLKSSGPDRGKPTFCTGFLALRNTEPTMTLVRDWKERLELGEGRLNQGEFNKAVYACDAKDKLRAKALPEVQFPTGNRYRNYSQEKRDRAVMMHNNYCRGGDCKQTRMEQYGLWDPATVQELL